MLIALSRSLIHLHLTVRHQRGHCILQTCV
uniref:Uncharacterized protein n=1 Tax=Arundo donax TaxID=35708 RepID=A0A0A9GGV9_ARUDO